MVQFQRLAWACINLALMIGVAYVFVLTAFQFVVFANMNSDARVQLIPDDAYYYLVLARNFAESGRWTFDNGNSTATGFHLLHAYALSLLYLLFKPSQSGFETLLAGLSTFLVLCSGAIASIAVYRAKSMAGGLLLILFGTSIMLKRNELSGMEWPWVVLIAALYAVLLATPRRGRTGRLHGGIFFAGMFGSLARSDFGLFPATLMLLALIQYPFCRDRPLLTKAVSGFLGACLGVLAVFLHCYLVSGHFLQSSARMKAFWPHDPHESLTWIFHFILEFFGEPGGFWSPTVFLTLCVLLISILAGVKELYGASGDSGKEPVRNGCLARNPSAFFVLWAGGLTTVALYILFYTRSAVVQPWYTANLAVPVFLAVAAPFLSGRIFVERELCVCLVLAVLLGRQIEMGDYQDRYIGWKWQILSKRAGDFLANLPGGGRVGCWNAGVVSYYSGREVINLDGLVNDDILPYVKSNALLAYIDEKHIRFIADYERMFDGDYRKRGGYDDPAFAARLKLLKVTPKVGDVFRALRILEVLPPGQAAPDGVVAGNDPWAAIRGEVKEAEETEHDARPIEGEWRNGAGARDLAGSGERVEVPGYHPGGGGAVFRSDGTLPECRQAAVEVPP